MVRITGYVTESHGRKGFKIKIIEDNVEDEKGRHPEVSKEVDITINETLYQKSGSIYFEEANEGRLEEIQECLSNSLGLRTGDMIKCQAWIVERNYDENVSPYKHKLNDDPNVKLSYTKYELFLIPHTKFFRRLVIDTPQSLKFRKKNYYMDRNRAICGKICGNSTYEYRKEWWIKINPKLLFPVFAGIWFKTKVSKLWGYLSAKSLAVLGVILGVIGIIVTILIGILGIIF